MDISPPQTPAPALSLVIPAKDEALRLPRTLTEILTYDWSSLGLDCPEIWVINDGSTDHTATLVKDWQQRHPHLGLISYPANRGKGHALKTGILRARGEWILILDADGATPIGEIKRLWQNLTPQTPIVIGSRVLTSPETTVKTVWHRKWIGWIFVRLVQWFAVQGIYDTQCGFKLLAAPVAQDIAKHLTLDGFSVDVEMLFIAQRRSYGIAEVSINWINQPGSKVKILQDSWRMLQDMIGIRLKAQQGVYERYLTSNPQPQEVQESREYKVGKTE